MLYRYSIERIYLCAGVSLSFLLLHFFRPKWKWWHLQMMWSLKLTLMLYECIWCSWKSTQIQIEHIWLCAMWVSMHFWIRNRSFITLLLLQPASRSKAGFSFLLFIYFFVSFSRGIKLRTDRKWDVLVGIVAVAAENILLLLEYARRNRHKTKNRISSNATILAAALPWLTWYRSHSYIHSYK